MKKRNIYKCRVLCTLLVLLITILAFAAEANAVVDMPGASNGSGLGQNNMGMDGFGNGGGAIGTDRNGTTHKNNNEGNLGDKDGDGVIEDKGNDGGIGKDIMDMGSEIVSDIGDAGNKMANDVKNKANDMNRGADSGVTDNGTSSRSPVLGIVLAALVAVALVILILLFIPGKKERRR